MDIHFIIEIIVGGVLHQLALLYFLLLALLAQRAPVGLGLGLVLLDVFECIGAPLHIIGPLVSRTLR